MCSHSAARSRNSWEVVGVVIAFPLIRHIRARSPYQRSPCVARLFLEARLDGRGRVAEATHRFGEAVIADAEFLPPIRELVIGQADQIDVLLGGFRLVVGHGMVLVGAASR